MAGNVGMDVSDIKSSPGQQGTFHFCITSCAWSEAREPFSILKNLLFVLCFVCFVFLTAALQDIWKEHGGQKDYGKFGFSINDQKRSSCPKHLVLQRYSNWKDSRPQATVWVIPATSNFNFAKNRWNASLSFAHVSSIGYSYFYF